jgi:demethylmacrocin O-methyltransferase
MWAEYFPRGRITGLDIEEKRLILPPSVTVLQGSQSDAALLARIWEEHGPFDIIIDDGSHRSTDVLASLRALYPRMAPGAFYVVEDVQTAFWPDFDGNPAATGTIVELAHRIFLAMHAIELRARGQEPTHTEFGDITAAIHLHRNLIAFERGANTYPSNYAYDPSDPRPAPSARRSRKKPLALPGRDLPWSAPNSPASPATWWPPPPWWRRRCARGQMIRGCCIWLRWREGERGDYVLGEVATTTLPRCSSSSAGACDA